MSSVTNQPPTSDRKSRRHRFKRTPLDRELLLTPRDNTIFSDIQSHGGLLSTGEISWRWWPPDLEAMLRYWKLDHPTISQLRAQYTAAYLYQKMETLKFLRKILRLRTSPERTTAEDERLRAWLLNVYQTQPEIWTILEEMLIDLEQMSPKAWLLQTVVQDICLPETLRLPPVQPSKLISSACIKRLRLLFDAGWLEKDEILTKMGQGRGQTLWYLSRKARTHLAKLRGVSVKDVPWKQVGAYGHLHTAHRLAINDFRIAVTIAAERLGFTLKRWLDEDDLRRKHSQQKLELLADPNNPDSKIIQRRLVPDSFFWLETDKNWFHFLEIDRATETLQYSDPGRDLQFWGLKIRKYGLYFKDWYSQTYPEAKGRGRILVVTTSQTRLENMAQVCQQLAGKAARRYWLTTYDKIKPQPEDYFAETVLTGDIWQRADRLTEKRSLIW